MNRREIQVGLLLLLAATLVWTDSTPVDAASLFVSPNGDDSNPGTLERPFLTLPRAQRAARQFAGVEPVTVFLRGGTYYLRETLVFTPEDSGTESTPAVYRAYQNEQVVISGGYPLKDLEWSADRNGIAKAVVPADLATDQLFLNGTRLPMARYPNLRPAERIFDGYAADAIDPKRISHWSDPRGGFLHAMHRHMWGGFHYRLLGRTQDGQLLYEGGWQNNRQLGMHDRYRFVENIFEELDAPGEWFLDDDRDTLYLMPPVGIDPSTAVLETVRLRHLIEFRGSAQQPVRYVDLQRLIFRHASRTFMDNREPLLRSDWTTYRGGALLYDGAEDCSLDDCWIDQVGGNALFINKYNRRITIRGCHISEAGANGIAFVGDPAAARSPLFEYGERQSYATIDKTPGPQNDNYPADCLVEDCLIYRSGRIEKQTAAVQIALAQDITVRNCSIYDVPRAGINIGDGCWGGHVIEFCDVFDTVQETGDHGSFNSWGRDRFWGLTDLDLNEDAIWNSHADLPLLDVVKPITLRNNRWRCDHGWDIDLDDGSSHYVLVNNLCLNGGIKNREGFFRIVENNITVNNGFHPHVWYKHSNDVVRRNIFWTDHYLPAGGMPSSPWGKVMDQNLVHRPGAAKPHPAVKLAEQSQRDAQSIEADALFVDSARGDFRVREDSPAFTLGFANFPMDRFGVQRANLKKLAKTPRIPAPTSETTQSDSEPSQQPLRLLWQATVRNVTGPGDRSAYGLAEEAGVIVLHVWNDGTAARCGLRADDVILACNGTPVASVDDLVALQDQAAGDTLALTLQRMQTTHKVAINDYAFAVKEERASVDFGMVRLGPASSLAVSANPQNTKNEPLISLTDGRVDKNYGPVFANGIDGAAYRIDLGSVQPISQINSFSYNQNGNRARQRFVLYGSAMEAAPGWDVENREKFMPILQVDSGPAQSDFVATSIRRRGSAILGTYRWLIWVVRPISSIAGGENTAFQEFQVVIRPTE